MKYLLLFCCFSAAAMDPGNLLEISCHSGTNIRESWVTYRALNFTPWEDMYKYECSMVLKNNSSVPYFVGTKVNDAIAYKQDTRFFKDDEAYQLFCDMEYKHSLEFPSCVKKA